MRRVDRCSERPDLRRWAAGEIPGVVFFIWYRQRPGASGLAPGASSSGTRVEEVEAQVRIYDLMAAISLYGLTLAILLQCDAVRPVDIRIPNRHN
jgi:hypothetical protein